MEVTLNQVVIPIVLMILFGVPHGALDGAIIFRQFPTFRPRALLLIGYLLLCIVCALLWAVLPTFCLVVFLAMSVWHFGQSDQSNSGYTATHIWRVITDGGIWVILLPFSHQLAVRELFAVLGADASFTMQMISWLIIPWAILALANVAMRILDGHGVGVISTLSFGVMSILMPPLWSLCLYFCLWHSRRHVIRVLVELSSPRLGWIMMALLTLITVLLALLAFVCLPVSTLWTEAVTQVFFIGLFALTVPHMVLIDLYLPWTDRVGPGDAVHD
tara:strand:- start:27 stop:848 length:822 start_codon:yes stop_codon:yes gene_type:complete